MVKRLFKKKIVFGLLVTVVLLTALGMNYANGVDGLQTKALSLQEAIDLGLKNNPNLELAQLAVQKAQAEFNGAKETADDMEIEDARTYELGLVKWLNPKAKEVALILAQKSRDRNESYLKQQVETKYYDVLKAEGNLTIKRENLKYFQDQLKIAQTRYKVGTAAKVDVSIMEAAVASYQALVTSDENTYRTAVMELNRIIGLDLETPLKLTTKFNLQKTGTSIVLADTLKKALEENYEILAIKKGLEVQQTQYDVAKKYYNKGVTVFDTLELDTKTAQANVRKQEMIMTSTVKQSYLSLFSLEKMIDWQSKEIEKAKENARVYSLKYNAGLATSLDVKKANIDLEQAEEDLSETIYKYDLLKTQFKYNLFTTTGVTY